MVENHWYRISQTIVRILAFNFEGNGESHVVLSKGLTSDRLLGDIERVKETSQEAFAFIVARDDVNLHQNGNGVVCDNLLNVKCKIC